MIQELADAIVNAQTHRTPLPALTQSYPDLSPETAYAVQKAVVESRLTSDAVAGYKIGLSGAEQQRTSGLNESAAGILLESGRRTGEPTILLSEFRKLLIETEIALVIGEPISQPLKTAEALPKLCRAVMPAIELPNLAFPEGFAPKGVDMVAANVIAQQYILGEERDLSSIDINTIEVRLLHNGTEVNRGKGTDALGNQWEAGRWTINKLLAQGWRFQPGQIILTGLLGKMTVGQPGSYEADYGNFGQIRFQVC